MKKILILFGIILSIALNAQIPGNPDASGVITPGPPDWVTGLPVGDGEMKLQLEYLNSRTDSLTDFINPADSAAVLTTLTADSISTNAILYTDTYWTDLKSPFTTAKQGILSKPDFDYDNLGLLFPQNDTTENTSHILQFDHNRADSSDIEPHVHWKQMNANAVVWEMIWRWYDNGDLIPSTWNHSIATTDEFTYTSGTLAQITSFPMVDGDTLNGVSSIFECIFYRDDNVDGGAGSGDALGTEFDLHYEIDRPGSEEEYIKY